MEFSQDPKSPHIALIPSAGMGNLTPFSRLASLLLSKNCKITFVTAKSTVSNAESEYISFFLSTHPQVNHLEFEVIPPSSSNSKDQDPFFIQYNAVSRSSHLLHPLLSSSSPPLSAIFCDLLVAKSAAAISAELDVPYYVITSVSAKFLALCLNLPILVSDPRIFSTDCTEVEILGLYPLPVASIPLPFLKPNHPLGLAIRENIGFISEAKGIMVNSFDWLEAETFDALNNGKVSSNLPPILPIGPLEPYNELEKEHSQHVLAWLDDQPEKSVVYVSFGSRTALSNDQIRELGFGLQRSGCKFLWVVKTSTVDKDDKEELGGLLGDSFLQGTKNKGIVVKGWVNQHKILSHPAVGGFISHCGWNSTTEAAQRGVPVLAWPLHGDQRMNAQILQNAGLGILEETWGMGKGGEKLVRQEEIAKKIVELMEDAELRNRGSRAREEARKATEPGGSSYKAVNGVIEKL